MSAHATEATVSPPAGSGANAACSLTDEQHDWATAFTGIDTRASASDTADAAPGSSSSGAIGSSDPSTPTAVGEQQRDASSPNPHPDQASDPQTAGQDGTQRPSGPDRSSDTDAGDLGLMLDPKSAQSNTGGFTKTPEEVEKVVTDKFSKYIPKQQLANPASKVTNFQDNAAFQNELKQRHPDLKKNGIDPDTVVGESYKGKIFINKDKADIGTAYHEQMHHYSSAKFKSSLGVVSGVKFNEGVTEYLTRQLYSGDRSGHYDTEEQVAKAVANKVGDDVLAKAYFEGDDAAIKKVSDALAGK